MIILYLCEVSPLSELLLERSALFLCECESVSVFLMCSLTLCSTWSLFPTTGLQCSQEDKFCHALVCHSGSYLSPLPVCLLICSLSSTGDIIHATEGEKKGSLSSAPQLQRGCSKPQLLLQVNRGLNSLCASTEKLCCWTFTL